MNTFKIFLKKNLKKIEKIKNKKLINASYPYATDPYKCEHKPTLQ